MNTIVLCPPALPAPKLIKQSTPTQKRNPALLVLLTPSLDATSNKGSGQIIGPIPRCFQKYNLYIEEVKYFWLKL